MQLASSIDRQSVREQFFEACGEEFKRGASITRLAELSIDRGVWSEVEEDLKREGIITRVRKWVQHAKDSEGRRLYHSLPSLDSEGKEIPIYKDVAFLELEDYKLLLFKYEERVRDHIRTYRDLINQAKERYGYRHRVPQHVQPLLKSLDGE